MRCADLADGEAGGASRWMWMLSAGMVETLGEAADGARGAASVVTEGAEELAPREGESFAVGKKNNWS